MKAMIVVLCLSVLIGCSNKSTGDKVRPLGFSHVDFATSQLEKSDQHQAVSKEPDSKVPYFQFAKKVSPPVIIGYILGFFLLNLGAKDDRTINNIFAGVGFQLILVATGFLILNLCGILLF